MTLTADCTIIREAFTLTVSAEFSAGIHCISGRIGCGKSSLAHVLAGVEQPAAGNVSGSGGSSLLMQFVEYHLTASTVQKEIESWGVAGTEESFILFCVTPALLCRDPFTLSRGELKRLLLACILAADSQTLILDEPYASLDSAAKEQLTTLLKKRAGITILFSHEPPNAPCTEWKIAGGRLCRISA